MSGTSSWKSEKEIKKKTDEHFYILHQYHMKWHTYILPFSVYYLVNLSQFLLDVFFRSKSFLHKIDF